MDKHSRLFANVTATEIKKILVRCHRSKKIFFSAKRWINTGNTEEEIGYYCFA